MNKEADGAEKADLSGVGVVAIGAVTMLVLLPVVLGAVGHPKTALIMAALLLGFTVLVRPEGAARPLRWIPAGFGLFALVAAVVALLV